jgi:hypothetical protein
MKSPANISLEKTGDCSSTETITNEHHKKSSGVRVQLKKKNSIKDNHESFQT